MAMGYEQLEINKLLPSGELARKLRCFAGRVSVFRSTLAEELDLFRDALFGLATEGARFSIFLDASPFTQSSAWIIGTKHSLLSKEDTVQNTLLKHSIDPATFEETLLNSGLGGLASSSPAELLSFQLKALELLIALESDTPLIIVDAPFEGLSQKNIEFLANRTTQAAWQTKKIIIVTRLDVRPECWIENDLISRLQLEKPRSRTIGFGSTGSSDAGNEVRGALEKLRAANTEPQNILETFSPVGIKASTTSKHAKLFQLAVILMLSLLGISSFLLWQKLNPEIVTYTSLPNNTTSDTPRSAADYNPQLAGDLKISPSGEAKASQSLIKLLPVDIQKAWTESFSGTLSLSEGSSFSNPDSTTQEEVDASSDLGKMFRALKSAK